MSQFDPATYDLLPIRTQIARLLSAAVRHNAHGEYQTPAIQCQVVLEGHLQPIMGALSICPDDQRLLRMLYPAKIGDGSEMLVEMFFEYSRVVSITVQREIKPVESSRLIVSAS